MTGIGNFGEKTHAEPAQKGTPVKIPEPEGWTEYYSFFLSSFSFFVLAQVRMRKGEGDEEKVLKVVLTWRQR